MIFGFLNLHKPSGLTSHDCVARVRRSLKIKQVGHGGTLDPLATGVLPIAVGKATRLLSFLPEAKVYRARVRFGVCTNTDDLEGEVIQSHECQGLTLEEITPLIPQFIGNIEQIPPVYSAIQQGGKRLYQLARQGEMVTVPPRLVQVKQIQVLAWYPGDFPELDIEISCGPGTYIRAIARDLGNLLGVGATLSQLTRTLSGGFSLEDSLDLENLSLDSLIPPEAALPHLPKLQLTTEDALRWSQGQKILISESWEKKPDSIYTLVYDPQGLFLGLGTIPEWQDFLVPKIVFKD